MVRFALFSVVFLAMIAPFEIEAQDIRAKTTDGREVILKSDGTWMFFGEFKKDKKAVQTYKSKRGVFALYHPAGAWKKLDTIENDAAEVGFSNREGDIHALIIAERLEIPLDTLKKAIVENMKAVDKKAKIVFEEKRIVNGRQMLCLTLEASVEGIDVTYHGYYFSGEEGSIQVMSWTGRKLFKELKPEMENFLNGFEILKK